jgi:hypothetical protein
MNLIQAIRTDKPFKRRDWVIWVKAAQEEGEFFLQDVHMRLFVVCSLEDLLADDWEIQKKGMH